jgi:hypothetical protein
MPTSSRTSRAAAIRGGAGFEGALGGDYLSLARGADLVQEQSGGIGRIGRHEDGSSRSMGPFHCRLLVRAMSSVEAIISSSVVLNWRIEPLFSIQ